MRPNLLDKMSNFNQTFLDKWSNFQRTEPICYGKGPNFQGKQPTFQCKKPKIKRKGICWVNGLV